MIFKGNIRTNKSATLLRFYGLFLAAFGHAPTELLTELSDLHLIRTWSNQPSFSAWLESSPTRSQNLNFSLAPSLGYNCNRSFNASCLEIQCTTAWLVICFKLFLSLSILLWPIFDFIRILPWWLHSFIKSTLETRKTQESNKSIKIIKSHITVCLLSLSIPLDST